jgi:hypothetical protein
LKKSTLAVMQPYFFPYIGYFQLVHACDTFVFYDDVTYIKSGWINRNRILMHNAPCYFIVPVSGASSSKLINEVAANTDLRKLEKTIVQAYRKAPYFNEVIDIILCVIRSRESKISSIAGLSVKSVSNYLGLDKNFLYSSNVSPCTRGLERSDRLIAMARQYGCDSYINSSGGIELYEKCYFAAQGVDLKFIYPELLPYRQYGREFIAGLSIIDVLMFNSRDRVIEMLRDYRLE